MEDWYDGKANYHYPHPSEDEKITAYDHKLNSILTFNNASLKKATYLRDLKLSAEHFKSKIIADIGSGPLPPLLIFKECKKRYCIDHLIDDYRKAGYPHHLFENDVTFLNSKSEHITLPDNSVDAVLSVNALDHVDNFEATAAEIMRILRPGGELHLLINCHQEKTSTEPLSLNRDKVKNAFASFGNLFVVSSNPGAYGFSNGETVLFSSSQPT